MDVLIDLSRGRIRREIPCTNDMLMSSLKARGLKGKKDAIGPASTAIGLDVHLDFNRTKKYQERTVHNEMTKRKEKDASKVVIIQGARGRGNLYHRADRGAPRRLLLVQSKKTQPL